MVSINLSNLSPELQQELLAKATNNNSSIEIEIYKLLNDNLKATMANNLQPSASASCSSNQPLEGKNLLLIIGGGIAAYKSLDLIRRLKEKGANLKVVLTKRAMDFVTKLSVSALNGEVAYTDLFCPDQENQIGHIGLAKWADLIIIAPLTANRMAKIAAGMADDLAGAILLANTKPVLIAPAMNPNMWANQLVKANYEKLLEIGYSSIGPEIGEMAEPNSYGTGRMAQVPHIVSQAIKMLTNSKQSLQNKKIIITTGPTREHLDPVRYITNHSSGKQGHAIAQAVAALGAQVILVTGSGNLAPIAGVEQIKVYTADEMYQAIKNQLPCDCAVLTAAVADWKAVEISQQKIKKTEDNNYYQLELQKNIDILKTIGHLEDLRPKLVIGFAAETENLVEYATSKLQRKNADWILANDVSPQADGSSVFGSEYNQITLITKHTTEAWPRMPKLELAKLLADKIANFFANK